MERFAESGSQGVQQCVRDYSLSIYSVQPNGPEGMPIK
jgi:hypothetical protein